MKHFIRPIVENYHEYLWHMHCNGDVFAEYWRPFHFDEWVMNGMPIHDGGVKLDDGTEHKVTFRY
jgi:hypothetical protein